MSKRIGLFIGPLIALAMLIFAAPGDMPVLAWRTAAVAVCMAIWWGTEALPPFATALVPLIAFPLLGIVDFTHTAQSYAHPLIFLFLGGFVLALTIERWDLHKRVALHVLLHIGVHARALVLGFMLATALLSMWMTNTATAMMMLPIAMSILAVVFADREAFPEHEMQNFEVLLPLGVAYGATIGGIATLIGTPPNAFLAAFLQEQFHMEISFARWMLVGVPVAMILLPASWFVLTRFVYPVNFKAGSHAHGAFAEMLRDMGPMRQAEKRVALVFVLVALSWAFRKLIVSWTGLTSLTDSGIAIAGALVLFLLPSGTKDHQRLADGETMRKLPFTVLLLFGGGLALAKGIAASGLAHELGGLLGGLGAVHALLLVAAATTLVIFLTELTSNLATTAAFLPVVSAVGVDAGLSPLLLSVPVALAASCAFMLPIATPPNAICYGSGLVSLQQMARAGFWLNLMAIVVLVSISVFWVPVVFH